MKKIIFYLFIIISVVSCTVTVTENSGPVLPNNLEGETLTDRYGRTYYIDHKHSYNNGTAYCVSKINNVIVINDTVYVENIDEVKQDYETGTDF